MIKSIHVKNFKTLLDVTIPLAPKITVMVGANNSGKSNALAVLKLIGEAARRRDVPEALQSLGGSNSVRPKPQGGPLEIIVDFETSPLATPGAASSDQDQSEIILRNAREDNLSISLTGRQPSGMWRSVPSAEQRESTLRSLSSVSVFDFSVSSLRAASLVQRNARLGPDGKNAAAALDAMAGEDPALRDQIEAEVRLAAPDIKKLLTQPSDEPGKKILGIEETSGAVFGAEAISDGLLLFIGMSIAAQSVVSQRSLIAIEEPERGVHPRRMRALVDQLLRITESGTQVVLTTHSPILLDEFKDYPESVLIFDRDKNGTHVTRLSDKPEWMEDVKQGPLGDIWYSGILGGVP